MDAQPDQPLWKNAFLTLGQHVVPENKLVIVVDDEPVLRSVMQRLLHRLSYTSLGMPHAAAATSMLDDTIAQIEAIFIDLPCPPRIDTRVLRLMALAPPNARIVLMTRIDTPQLHRIAANLQPVVILPKPFGLSDLDNLLGSFRTMNL